MSKVYEIETKTETITHEVKTTKCLKCDVCDKEFVGKYWNLCTHHNDWGNDSCESFEYFDLCSEDCVRKKLDEYFDNCETSYTQKFELEQDFFRKKEK